MEIVWDATQKRDHRATRLLTLDNCEDVFEYLPDYRVLICKEHGHAVYAWKLHVQKLHAAATKELRAIAERFSALKLIHPSKVSSPPKFTAPFGALGEPFDAFLCDGDTDRECDYISIHPAGIRQHCNKAHGWKYAKDDPEHWTRVKVQTFFQGGGFRRYFIVRPPGEQQRGAAAPARGEYDDDATVIKGQWAKARERRDRELDVADEEFAKTDRTGWFKRTGWPEHLRGCNLKRLAHLGRMPDRDEHELKLAAEVVALAIEKCVAGLTTLPHETRRWLRSARREEVDVRPMARLQNPESQSRYALYMQRFVCYCLRVAAMGRDGDDRDPSDRGDSTDDDGSGDSDTGSSSDEESEGEEERGAGEVEGNEEEKLRRDVRRLCVWHGDQKELLEETRWSLAHAEEKEQVEKMIRLLGSFVLHTVGGRPFSSPLIHFLAVLGIDEEGRRLRRAEDYSYILAGVVYCARVVGAEVLLPSGGRDEQGAAETEGFLDRRRELLADGSYSVMSTMLSLLAYSKSIALNVGNEGLVHWSPDRKWFTLRGRRLVIERWKSMVQDAVHEAERLLWEEVMWTRREERFTVPLDKIVDDVTFTRRGISFASRSSNGLAGGLEWMVDRMRTSDEGRKMRKNAAWNVRLVRRYLRTVEKFLEMLLFCTHTTAGQPARGTEITTARFRNGFLQDRNIYIIDGRAVLVTRYHKSQSQFDKPKVIPRFLPWRVGQLMAVYLGYVQPFREHLTVEVSGAGWSDHVWSTASGPWETEKLTAIISRESTNRLGERLTTLDYRHAVISIGRVFVGDEFAAGYKEEVGEVEEPEVEVEDGLEISAGRTEKIGVQRYGVPSDIVKHLSMRSMETFRPLSEAWHRFLGLSSDEAEEKRKSNGEGGCRKRKRIEFEPDTTLADGALRSPPAATPATPAGRKRLYNGIHVASARVQKTRVDVGSAEFGRAMRRALGRADVSFRSREQEVAMEAVLAGQTPLVVVLPTGGGKSLLFTAPACLDDPGVTIVVAPFRALVDDMVGRLRRTGIDCLEWRTGEVNAAAVVVVSADIAGDWRFLGYASLLCRQGLLRRVVVDECHLVITSSDYRPKLAHLKRLRSLRCPVVLLTATLPPVLEVDLGESMLVPLARYVRAATVRKNTRYSVHWCAKGEDAAATAVAMVRRRGERLGGQKGVVYCRTRAQCESVAEELGCGYYHAGSIDKEERLKEWVEEGGFIVATSALGTGVDYPGIVLVVHVGLPYGMIDFAQESGRAGRGGEAVDSVVLVSEREVEQARRKERTVDEDAMLAFVEADGCRRGVMSRYLDGEETECSDAVMAGCDRCGEGSQDWQASQTEAEQRWGVVKGVLDELADGCAACWVCQEGEDDHMHSMRSCRRQAQLTQEACDEFRRVIRYEVRSHSCTKCGISQKFCATGREDGRDCQWANVMVPIVKAGMANMESLEVIRRVGYGGGFREWGAYGQWLGRRYKRRYWGEWMSNAMVVMVEMILFIKGLE